MKKYKTNKSSKKYKTKNTKAIRKKYKTTKRRKTKQTYKPKDFIKMYKEKENLYLNEYYKCSRKCSKISSKKHITKKKNCWKKCEDTRLNNIQNIQKQYPKEWKNYLDNL